MQKMSSEQHGDSSELYMINKN